jgi:peptide deformylase
MAVKNILLLGDPRLYEVSVSVKREELDLLTPQINLLFETILDFRKIYGRGRAIAAPQIGLKKRIICLNIDKPIVIINPELSNFSEDSFELWDDCMSFPNLLVKIKRFKTLTLSFLDGNWEKQVWYVKDDLSELIQHEYDHLDGILAIQRAVDSKSFRWILKKEPPL